MSGHIHPSPPDRYEAISNHLLAQARIELNKGDILQASDKVWGATAHALKAVCQRMGWNHHAHNHINAAANYIATELGREDLRRDFVYVESLHTNWYEHQRSIIEIRTGLDSAASLAGELAGLSLPPQPGSLRQLTALEMNDQQRLLRMLTRKTQYSHGAQLQGAALANLPPVNPAPADDGDNDAG